MKRYLSLKTKTWGSILLILVGLFSLLLLVEAQRKNDVVPQADAQVLHAPYRLDSDIRNIVLSLTAVQFGKDQVDAMDNLLSGESNFNKEAINPTSGACGIFQADPCQKLLDECGSLDNVSCQIEWGFNYISQRYGNPKNAWAFKQIPHYVDGQYVYYY